MRLFVGIGLGTEAVDALRGVRERFARADDGLRWSAEESWHVTLQFLGSADVAQAACLMEQLDALRAAGVPVRIAGLDFVDRAGVFHARVVLTAELLALQQKVTAATRACGFVAEARAYSPHITLARVKGHGNAKALAPLQRAVERARVRLCAEFVADEFRLYESVPGPEGSRYEVRARYRLKTRLYRHIGTAGVGSEQKPSRRPTESILRSQPCGTGCFLLISLSLVAKICRISATPRSVN